MIGLNVFVLIFLAGCRVCADNVFECNTKIDSSIEIIRTSLASKDPMTMNDIPGTKQCNFSGIVSLARIPNIDTISEITDAGSTTTSYLHIPGLNIICVSEIPDDPSQFATYLNKAVTDQIQPECPVVDDALKNAENSTKLRIVGCGSIVSKDVDSVSGVVNKAKGSLSSKKNALVTEVFVITWNIELSLKTFSKAGSRDGVGRQVVLLSKDYNNIKVRCKENVSACQCLVGTEFTVYAVAKFLSKFFLCNNEIDNGKLLRMLDCSDSIEYD